MYYFTGDRRQEIGDRRQETGERKEFFGDFRVRIIDIIPTIVLGENLPLIKFHTSN
ncbi:MAG: hypothetical protein F6K39_26495 [Okeania sp. SIO3B3]|nr:hypothetical protein [Okeania sp. SIO3B3]